jgi:mannose-6-phosphate isomerase-like protein (cupin superfamily)
MNPEIKKYSHSKEFYTQEACYIREISNSSSDPELSIAQARVKPGVTTRWHSLHGITERYCILQGEGIVEVAELEPQRVSRGDIVIIPASCRQRIHNAGESDLIFLAICSPRFTGAAYQQLEE